MRKIALIFCILSLDQFVNAQSGTLDPRFGTGGYILTPAITGTPTSAFAKQCFIESDGKISIVIYGIKSEITRRLPDGSIDVSYGHNGYSKVTSLLVNAAIEQADGKIVVAGTRNGMLDFMLARYNTDGTLDASFGNSGVVIKGLGASFEFLNAVTENKMASWKLYTNVRQLRSFDETSRL